MSLNKALLMGNLGADPELKYTPSQTPVCTLRIATNERRKNQSGEWTDHTEWHTVVCFGKTAENCNQYLAKGRPVFVEGRIQTRKWQDQEGKDRYFTEIVASSVQFLGGGKNASNLNVESSFGDNAAPVSTKVATGTLPASAPVSFDDDDIPF